MKVFKLLDNKHFKRNMYYLENLLLMNEQQVKEIIEHLLSKQKDCITFSKKYEQREMQDLYQYYEGASWALKFALSLFSKEK